MEFAIRLFDGMNTVMFENAQPIHIWLRKLDNKGTYERKFIVLCTNTQMSLVIGPTFVDKKDHPDFYMHKHLRQLALAVLAPKGSRCDTAGGGTLAFKKGMFSDKWEAELGGRSSDYGVWDNRILAHQTTIAGWLGLRTQFVWRSTVEPKVKVRL